jgi:hypothetical protein
VKGWGGLETRKTRKDKQSQNKTKQDKKTEAQIGDKEKTRQDKNQTKIDGGTPPTTAVAMYNRFLRSIDNRLRIH